MTGEILLVIDGQIQDSAVYKTDSEKHKIFQQFLAIKELLISEHPYSKINVDYRETEK